MFKQRRLGELEPIGKLEKICTLSIIVILLFLVVALCWKGSKSELNVEMAINAQKLTSTIVDTNPIYLETSSTIADLKKDLSFERTKVGILEERIEKIKFSADEILSKDPSNVDDTAIESVKEDLQEVEGWLAKVEQDCNCIYDQYQQLRLKVDNNRNRSNNSKIQKLSNIQRISVGTPNEADLELYDLYSYLYDIQVDRCFAEMSYIEISNQLEDYQKLVDFENMKRSLKKKLSTVKISSKADISQVIGLTEEEIRYLLECSGLIENPEIIQTLPRVMVETVKEYPVNELWSIAVMASETGHFTSNLALNHFNYGGMMGLNGAMHFDSVEEGLYRAIRCLYLNMENKPKKTIAEVNKSYCPDSIPGWTNLVMDVLSLYVTSDID